MESLADGKVAVAPGMTRTRSFGGAPDAGLPRRSDAPVVVETAQQAAQATARGLPEGHGSQGSKMWRKLLTEHFKSTSYHALTEIDDIMTQNLAAQQHRGNENPRLRILAKSLVKAALC